MRPCRRHLLPSEKTLGHGSLWLLGIKANTYTVPNRSLWMELTKRCAVQKAIWLNTTQPPEIASYAVEGYMILG